MTLVFYFLFWKLLYLLTTLTLLLYSHNSLRSSAKIKFNFLSHRIRIYFWLTIIYLRGDNHTYLLIKLRLSQALIPSTTFFQSLRTSVLQSIIASKLNGIKAFSNTAPCLYFLQQPSIYFQIVHHSFNLFYFELL